MSPNCLRGLRTMCLMGLIKAPQHRFCLGSEVRWGLKDHAKGTICVVIVITRVT